MTIFVERETGTASKAHYRFDAMEKTIIASIDAQNEYSELVKTQTSEEMLDIKGFVTATNHRSFDNRRTMEHDERSKTR